MQQRQIVIVLGMHRSGTSLCANMLAALGVDMADEPGASPANQRGHWERPRINDWHDEVFAIFGRRWADASHHLALPEVWWEDRRVLAVRDQLVTWLAPRLASGGRFGFKDPRTSRLWAMWPGVLDALGARPTFVFCVRDPSQVARSISARDRIEREQAEYRWLVYNAQAIDGVGGSPVCVVPYEDWFVTPEATIGRLAGFVGGASPGREETLGLMAAAVLDPSLRHDGQDGFVSRPMVSRLHRHIAEAAGRGNFGPELLGLAENVVAFDQAALPLLREVVSLKVGLGEQARVIGDLNGLIERLRAENASLRKAGSQGGGSDIASRARSKADSFTVTH